ncbi:amidase [Deinococcus alpinitundrae]|uniref:amidase n=1 Tax=Deinococcus alpinitundrae TaxID=468913 RepID=UPI00137B2BA3|nr:amidase [Deinococcus alpinitundrae]
MTRPDPSNAFGAWAYQPPQPLPGAAGGPLSDLTFNVKDLYGVEGWPLRASTQASLPPVVPSPLVTRLLELGATLTGKTHLHEIALGITGANPVTPGRNPLDPARVPGGSSSGAAITVARAEVDFALGTDTGGSIRVPAAWCGVVGFKPTKDHPAWPTTGLLPLSQTCDHPGPLTRGVAMAARLHAALGGETVVARSWNGLRVGLWRPEAWLQPEALAALDGARETAEGLGATFKEVLLPDMLDAYSPIVQSEAAILHAAALGDSPTGFSAGTEALLRLGAARPHEEVRAARARRDGYRARLEDLFTQFDVLLAPAVPGVAPLSGQEELALPEGQLNSTRTPLRVAVLRLTVPFSLLGVPVVSLPCPAGALSVGLQLVGTWNTDAELLGLALSLEAALS